MSSDKESLASSLSSSNDSEDDGESMSEQSDDVEVIDSVVEPVVVPVPPPVPTRPRRSSECPGSQAERPACFHEARECAYKPVCTFIIAVCLVLSLMDLEGRPGRRCTLRVFNPVHPPYVDTFLAGFALQIFFFQNLDSFTDLLYFTRPRNFCWWAVEDASVTLLSK